MRHSPRVSGISRENELGRSERPLPALLSLKLAHTGTYRVLWFASPVHGSGHGARRDMRQQTTHPGGPTVLPAASRSGPAFDLISALKDGQGFGTTAYRLGVVTQCNRRVGVEMVPECRQWWGIGEKLTDHPFKKSLVRTIVLPSTYRCDNSNSVVRQPTSFIRLKTAIAGCLAVRKGVQTAALKSPSPPLAPFAWQFILY